MTVLSSIGNFFRIIILGTGPQEEVSHEEVEKYADTEQIEDGAPVEKESPLGYNVNYFTAMYLVIQSVIGTGIFNTPGTILSAVGSVGCSYVFWVVGFIVTLLLIGMYIEYTTYFRRRSGAEVAYLEQAFPIPKFLMPVMFAAVSVILSYVNSSASSFATYVFKGAGYDATAWEQRALSVAPLALACLLASINTRYCMILNNIIGFVKVIFVLFIGFSGFAALAGSTKAPKNHDIFSNAWAGTTTDGNSISSAILKVVFAFDGYPYAFAVAAETHPKNTIKVYKYFIPLTMFIIFIMYILCVTAYYAGIQDIEEITSSGTLVAAVYFEKIFETEAAVRAMCGLVALSSFGHLLTAFLGHSRALRECGRQGVLPYPKLWTSVKPFGTPIFPLFATFVVNLIVLLAPPPGDAYNFIVDLGTYSQYVFKVLLVVGLFKVRKQRKKLGLGFREFHLPTFALWIILLWTIFVLAMAFVPPKGTLIGDDVSFFYCTYAITTYGILALCVLYYVIWMFVVPHFKGYEWRAESYELSNGERGNRVIKVPKDELAEWDHEHGKPQGLSDIGFDDENTGVVDTSITATSPELSEKSPSVTYTIK